MNSRERLLTAMTGGQPDQVPCTPDFSNMIPCRLTGKPFWDIYLHLDPPLWRAYLAAANHFGIDAWFYDGHLGFHHDATGVEYSHEIVARSEERLVQRTVITTPDGELTGETTYYVSDPPTPTEKLVKDLARDFPKLRHLFPVPTGYTTEPALRQKQEVGEHHAFGACIGYPGFQNWMGYMEGGVAPLVYAEMDCPAFLEEWRELHEKVVVTQMEMILDSGLFDYVLLGGSGSITLANPTLFDKYALPTLKKLTAMCKSAGVATMLHSCGKEAYLVQRAVEETDLNCINPLEIPPMGDCVLADIKQRYGDRIALMGNLHTTDIMLRGSVAQVEAAARQAIDDAAAGGGFILSTGDQCGRDTPDANIRKLVEVCENYGRYD